MKDIFSAKIIINKSGRGKVRFSEEETLSLSKREMFKVFPGDEVMCVRLSGGKAKISKILKRNTTHLTGIIRKSRGQTFLKSLDNSFHLEVILEGNNLKKYKADDICFVKITSQPSLKYKPKAKPVKIIKSEDVFEESFIVATSGVEISKNWQKGIINECKKLQKNITEEEIQKRKDFRNLGFITVDGSNARDFDDALYAEKTSEGFKLFVAIADVSEYVKEGSSLDIEAYNRSTSIYFEKHVIPMLPELISNQICSLRPNEDKLTLTCIINLDKDGHISKYEFCKSVIRSQKRLSYEELEDFLDNKKTKYKKNLTESIENLAEIHKRRKNLRKNRGAVDFNLREFRPVSKKNKITRFKQVKKFTAHQIIEESMILANICAARFARTNKRPSMYRHHENPDLKELDDLKEFLKTRGFKKAMKESNVRNRINLWLEEISKNKKSSIIFQVLRSMKLAIYSGEKSSHFALALDEYSHFTSPIRRYPDLVVHRIIKKILDKTPTSYSQNKIDEISNYCSEKERETEKIVRNSTKYLSCKCAENHIGKIFPGEIISILDFGFFVHIDELNIEGFCHIKRLGRAPYYIHDEISRSLRSANNNHIYSIGDRCKIKIESVEITRNRIDLKLN